MKGYYYMKKIKKYGCFIFIIVIGLLDIIYGVYIYKQKEDFIKNSKVTKGYIYSISNNNSKNKALYINYYINNQKYEGIIMTSKKNIEISEPITIYYDELNPKKISSSEVKHPEIIIIILGFVFTILGFNFMPNFIKKN